MRVPTDALSKLSSSTIATSVDGEKLKAANKQVVNDTGSFPTTDGGAAICLPSSKEGLEMLRIVQTELSLAATRLSVSDEVDSVIDSLLDLVGAMEVLHVTKKSTFGLA